MKAKTIHAAATTVLLATCRLIAQETAGQRHAMATNQLKRLAGEMSAHCLKEIETLDDWKKQRARRSSMSCV